MDFYKIEGHNSAPQIFKEIILSKRTGKAEQHSPPIPTTHQEIETPVWECVWECLMQQYLHNAWNLGGTSQAQSPQTWQVLVRAMGRAGLFLTGLNLSPTTAKCSFVFTGKLCARFREKFTLENQGVDSQSTGCTLVWVGTSTTALQDTL